MGSIKISAFLLGFSAMISQIVFVREFLIAFSGNEVSMGVVLAFWFLWVAAGARFLGKFSDAIRDRRRFLSACQFFLFILIPLEVLLIRWIKPVLNIATGETVSFTLMILAVGAVLAPACVVFGFMFSLCCAADACGESSEKIGKVYYLEAAGAAAGGLLASFVLIRWFSSVQIASGIGSLNLLFGASGFFLAEKKNKLIGALASAVFVLNVFLLFTGVWNKIDKKSLEASYRGYELISSKNSIYGNVTVVKRDGQISFFYDGTRLYTTGDFCSAEEAVHFALLEHPSPGKVLLIGGGVAGLLKEVLKHPVEKVVYVELDPLVIEEARKCLPLGVLHENKVSVKNTDGRFFVKNTREKYDCVIVSVGSPLSAQVNRFYTVEFFGEVKKILNVQGILSFGLASSEDYISPPLAEFLSSIRKSLGNVFKDVRIIPGFTAYFLSSDGDALTCDYRKLLAVARERKLNLKFVRDYYLSSKMSGERIKWMEDVLDRCAGVSANRDFRPAAYYYNFVFWASRLRNPFLKNVLIRISSAGFMSFAGAGLFLLLLFRFFSRKKESAVLLTVMTAGFSEIVLQMVVLISFQVIYGFLFYKLGVILTSFMMGMAFGGFAAVRSVRRIKNIFPVFVGTQAVICLFPLIMVLFIAFFSGSQNSFFSFLTAKFFYFILPLLTGFAGGFQFPLACRILSGPEKTGRLAGKAYAFDLLGASAGAFAAGTFLLPVLGMYKVCYLAAFLNAIALILLFSYNLPEQGV
ncbi:MAG: fused MFS/spermidine synthase [bacterium]